MMPLGDSITDGYNVPGGYRIKLWHAWPVARLRSTSSARWVTGQPASMT